MQMLQGFSPIHCFYKYFVFAIRPDHQKTPQKTRGCLFIKIKCSPIPMAYTVKPALKGTSI